MTNRTSRAAALRWLDGRRNEGSPAHGFFGDREYHSVVYKNPATASIVVAALYVIATRVFSGYRYIVVLGALNLVGLIVVSVIKAYAFTSVWCAYAAIISILIYGHFHYRRQAEALGAILVH